MSLKTGNYFEYEVNGGLLRYYRAIVGDTIRNSTGIHYYKIKYKYANYPISYYFERIDSNGNWYQYFSSSQLECLLYKLDIPINGTFIPNCGTNTMRLIDTFSLTGILEDSSGFKVRKYNLESIAPEDDYVARKFQMYYQYNYEGANFTKLVGAIIDSVVYGSITGINVHNKMISGEYKLFQNYPNPFNSSTIIKFDIPKSTFITLEICDLTGRKIRTLMNHYLKPGSHSVVFDASDLSSGIYFYRLIADNYVETKKLILIK